MKLTIKIEVNSKSAEYTEFAEREFETEGEMRDAYNAVLDLLNDTEPGDTECGEKMTSTYCGSMSESELEEHILECEVCRRDFE